MYTDWKNAFREKREKKLNRNRKLTKLQKAIVGGLTLAAVTGGSFLIWDNYKSGNLFEPGVHAFGRKTQENMVTFPGEEYGTSSNEKTEEETQKKNEKSDDSVNPDSNQGSGQNTQISPRITLVDDQNQAQNLIVVPGVNQNSGNRSSVSTSGNGSGTTSLRPDTSGLINQNGNSFNSGSDANGSNSDSNKNENNNGNNTNHGNNGNNGNNGNHGNNGNNGNNGNDNPSNPDNPNNPTYPDSPWYGYKPVEPDKSIPQDALDSWGMGYEDYPGEGKDSDEDADMASTYFLDLEPVGIDDYLNGGNKFYDGEPLNDWKLLCQVYAYVGTKDENGSINRMYRLRNVGENFKIKDYPEKAYEGFSATYCFRQNSKSEWQEITVTFSVAKRKVLVCSWKKDSFVNFQNNLGDMEAPYLKDGESMNLYSYVSYMMPQGEFLTELFPGWSETPEGEAVAYNYQTDKTGLVVLYPKKKVPLDENYKAEIRFCFSDAGSGYYQTLVDVDSDEKELKIPQYIQAFEWSGEARTVDTLEISDTVEYIDVSKLGNTDYFTLNEAYTVSEENSMYSALEGMLTDKNQTVIYDIPAKMETVVIPETITEVSFHETNTALKEVHFLSETPIDIDVSALKNAKLVVPADAYMSYLRAWGEKLGSNELCKDDGTEAEYVVENFGIYSTDKKTLNRLLSGAEGTYCVSDSVAKLEDDMMQEARYLERIVLGKNVTVLESDCLAGENLSDIVFTSKAAPKIEADTFGSSKNLENLQIRVPEGSKETYLKAWSSVIDADVLDLIIQEDSVKVVENNGWKYVVEKEGAVLVTAPPDIVEFTGETIEGVTFKEISANTFRDHKSLYNVELPESVKVIGRNAFSGCDGMESFFSASRDTIRVQYGVFNGCTAFRYCAFNAQYGEIDPEFQNVDRYIFFSPVGAEGYDTKLGWNLLFEDWADTDKGYEVLKLPDMQSVLYVDNQEYVNGIMLLASTSGVSGEITLPDNTKWIRDDTFMDCSNPFHLKNTDSLEKIWNGAFTRSGLTGDYDFPNVKHLGSSCFYSCEGLTGIKCEQMDSMGELIFAYSTSLKQIVLGDKVTDMGTRIIEGCTSLQSLTLSAEKPPTLIKASYYSPYSFGEGTPEEFRILLTGNASADAYIDKWKYFVAGYEEGEELSEEEELLSINYIRHLFGMEQITELPEKGENSGETKNPGEDGVALESAADSVEPSDAVDGAEQETQIQESKNEIETENKVENKTEETETQAQDKTRLE